MSEENNNSNNDLSRDEINEELDKVKNENSKKPGFLDALALTLFGPAVVTCYMVYMPPFMSGRSAKSGDAKICPKCHVKLQPDPEGKYDFRCPKCKKGYNQSDLTDSK